jgi:hypothetical protein
MKKALLLLVCAGAAIAQTAFRVDPTFVYTTPGNTPPGATAPVYAVPGSTVALYTNSSATTLATSYTSGAASASCPTTAQVVLSGSALCRSTTGPVGSWGAWLLPGSYWYTVTTNGITSGPYPITVGAGASGGVDWSTLVPGTNTLGSFLVGSGSSFGPTGAGTVNANVLGGILLTNLNGPTKVTGGIPQNSAAADIVGLFSGCSGTQALGADGACHTGSGSVTSVGLTGLSWLSVTGSPITVSGTLAMGAAAGQTPHQVIGTCGAATTFGPCALVASDLPASTGNAAV